MRSAFNMGIVAAVSAAAAHSAPQGYLAVVGPKPLLFARPPVPLAVAVARLPALAKSTPDPRIRYGSETNEPVLMPPPAPSTNAVAKPATTAGSGMTEVVSGVPGGDPGHGGTNGPPTGPLEGLLPGGSGVPGGLIIPEGLYPHGDPRFQDDRGLPLLSPQMLVPFFRTPATTNRVNPIYLSVPFLPARPAVPSPFPVPAASSTATYEQH